MGSCCSHPYFRVQSAGDPGLTSPGVYCTNLVFQCKYLVFVPANEAAGAAMLVCAICGGDGSDKIASSALSSNKVINSFSISSLRLKIDRLTASAANACGFLLALKSKTPRTKFRGPLQTGLRGVSDAG